MLATEQGFELQMKLSQAGTSRGVLPLEAYKVRQVVQVLPRDASDATRPFELPEPFLRP